MDIQAYISSGVLESYVLGELSPSEVQQVADMASRYPEVQAELALIEATPAGVVQAAAVAPRPELRASILDQITATAAPAIAATEQPAMKVLHPEVKMRPKEANHQTQTQPSRWLMAASVGLALLSSVAAVYFWSRWQQTEEQLASLEAQRSVLVQHVSTLENKASAMQQSLVILTDPAYVAVPMKGLAPAPTAQAMVYWNPVSEEVFLHPGSLPAAPTGKQYQLWAIVDGQPVDAGVFSTAGEQLIRMKAVQNASAFAVTLEPEGGSLNPTLDQMYVMGNAS